MPSKYTSDPWQRSTSTHLHGSASLPQYDGYASDLTFPGQVKKYFYPNSQDARTLWYHDHGVHHTSQNAYNGLAGLYILHDEEEAGLGIPTGAPGSPSAPYDVPMIVRDAMFATDGSLIYDDNSESGVYGDVPLINGVPWPLMEVEPRIYRFRILNASVSRSYEWSLSDGRSTVPMTVIGTDGGLMPQPKVVSKLPARHGGALRDHHRLQQVQGRPDHAEEHEPEEQHRLRLDESGHAVQGRERRHQRRRQRDPRGLVGEADDPRVHDLDRVAAAGTGRAEAGVQVHPHQRPLDDQRGDLGERHRQ